MKTNYPRPYGDIKYSSEGGAEYYNEDTGKYQGKPSNSEQHKDANARKFQSLMSRMESGGGSDNSSMDRNVKPASRTEVLPTSSYRTHDGYDVTISTEARELLTRK